MSRKVRLLIPSAPFCVKLRNTLVAVRFERRDILKRAVDPARISPGAVPGLAQALKSRPGSPGVLAREPFAQLVGVGPVRQRDGRGRRRGVLAEGALVDDFAPEAGTTLLTLPTTRSAPAARQSVREMTVDGEQRFRCWVTQPAAS